MKKDPLYGWRFVIWFVFGVIAGGLILKAIFL